MSFLEPKNRAGTITRSLLPNMTKHDIPAGALPLERLASESGFATVAGLRLGGRGDKKGAGATEIRRRPVRDFVAWLGVFQSERTPIGSISPAAVEADLTWINVAPSFLPYPPDRRVGEIACRVGRN